MFSLSLSLTHTHTHTRTHSHRLSSLVVALRGGSQLRTGPSLYAQLSGEVIGAGGCVATTGTFRCGDDGGRRGATALDKQCVFVKLADSRRGWALLSDKNTTFFRKQENLVL